MKPTAASWVLIKSKFFCQKKFLRLIECSNFMAALQDFCHWRLCLQNNQQDTEWDYPVGGLDRNGTFFTMWMDENWENSWVGCFHLNSLDLIIKDTWHFGNIRYKLTDASILWSGDWSWGSIPHFSSYLAKYSSWLLCIIKASLYNKKRSENDLF